MARSSPPARGAGISPAALGAVAAALVLVAAAVATGASADATGPARRHAAWDALLKGHVSAGRVDYRGLARERPRLDAYLAGLERTRPEDFRLWPRDDRVAFWINAYNAYTVKLILDHYPVESIWNVTPLWKRPLGGPFKLRFIPLGPLAAEPGPSRLSLDDIEHGILRARLGERRVHFAVVCASKGCPALRDEAFEGPLLARQLDRAAAEFLADPAKNRYDAASNTLSLSPIFDWFEEDFASFAHPGPAGLGSGAVAFFRRYGPKTARQALDRAERAPKVVFTEYDWSLNERRY